MTKVRVKATAIRRGFELYECLLLHIFVNNGHALSITSPTP